MRVETKNKPSIQCLLWDFGDTLCDERFIWSSGPEWMEVYQSFDDGGLGTAWNIGQIDTQEFARAVSGRLKRSPQAVVSHMTERCQHINFFQATYRFFRARHLPQAIVTVNPDLFSNVIVPGCGLNDHCDVIVTSWEEGTQDKRILNRLAIERLAIDCGFAEALLLDNKLSNVEQWEGVGGSAYHYQGDEKFARDILDGVDTLPGR